MFSKGHGIDNLFEVNIVLNNFLRKEQVVYNEPLYIPQEDTITNLYSLKLFQASNFCACNHKI